VQGLEHCGWGEAIQVGHVPVHATHDVIRVLQEANDITRTEEHVVQKDDPVCSVALALDGCPQGLQCPVPAQSSSKLSEVAFRGSKQTSSRINVLFGQCIWAYQLQTRRSERGTQSKLSCSQSAYVGAQPAGAESIQTSEEQMASWLDVAVRDQVHWQQRSSDEGAPRSMHAKMSKVRTQALQAGHSKRMSLPPPALRLDAFMELGLSHVHTAAVFDPNLVSVMPLCSTFGVNSTAAVQPDGRHTALWHCVVALQSCRRECTGKRCKQLRCSIPDAR
jgi:hypothetical protein